MSDEHDPDQQDQPVDDPKKLPDVQSAVDPAESKKRVSRKEFLKRQQREWFSEQLRNPIARQFLWDILAAAGTFEDRYGFGPYGQPNQPASERFAGQQQLGLRLYHSWSQLDRAGILSLLDEFHPGFEGK